jgi:hypothetical protein
MLGLPSSCGAACHVGVSTTAARRGLYCRRSRRTVSAAHGARTTRTIRSYPTVGRPRHGPRKPPWSAQRWGDRAGSRWRGPRAGGGWDRDHSTFEGKNICGAARSAGSAHHGFRTFPSGPAAVVAVAWRTRAPPRGNRCRSPQQSCPARAEAVPHITAASASPPETRDAATTGLSISRGSATTRCGGKWWHAIHCRGARGPAACLHSTSALRDDRPDARFAVVVWCRMSSRCLDHGGPPRAALPQKPQNRQRRAWRPHDKDHTGPIPLWAGPGMAHGSHPGVRSAVGVREPGRVRGDRVPVAVGTATTVHLKVKEYAERVQHVLCVTPKQLKATIAGLCADGGSLSSGSRRTCSERRLLPWSTPA